MDKKLLKLQTSIDGTSSRACKWFSLQAKIKNKNEWQQRGKLEDSKREVYSKCLPA